MILLGVAPCTAMVFVWSQLTKGDPNYTLVQVSINDIIMIFAFAPITGFLLGIANIECTNAVCAGKDVSDNINTITVCWTSNVGTNK